MSWIKMDDNNFVFTFCGQMYEIKQQWNNMVNIHAIKQISQSDKEKQKWYKQWQVDLHAGNRNDNINEKER